MDSEPNGLLDRKLTITRAPAIQRVDSNDPDELAERLSNWNLRLTQLHPGRFTGSLLIIPLESVMIVCGRLSKPLLQYSTPPDGYITINRPGRGSEAVTALGHRIEDDEVFVCGPDAEREGVNLGVHYPCTLSIRCDVLEYEAEWLTHSTSLTSIRGAQLHAPGVSWTATFLDAMEWIVDAVERHPEAMPRLDVRGSLVDSLLARVDMLAAADAPIHEDRQMRAHRRVAVERAREYIARNLTDPIRLSDLSRYAHTQARSLEYGFREVMGVSPMAYIRATRLHRAHRLLRTIAVRTRSISEIALDCGFWHLSQFAVDYKLLFGESPSVTYHRTEAGLPRSERRRQVSMQPLVGTHKVTAKAIRIGTPAGTPRRGHL